MDSFRRIKVFDVIWLLIAFHDSLKRLLPPHLDLSSNSIYHLLDGASYLKITFCFFDLSIANRIGIGIVVSKLEPLLYNFLLISVIFQSKPLIFLQILIVTFILTSVLINILLYFYINVVILKLIYLQVNILIFLLITYMYIYFGKKKN